MKTQVLLLLLIFVCFASSCEQEDTLSSAYKRANFAGHWDLEEHSRTYFEDSGDSVVTLQSVGSVQFDLDPTGLKDPFAIQSTLCDSVSFLAEMKNSGTLSPMTNGEEYRGFWTYTGDLQTFTIWGDASGVVVSLSLKMERSEDVMQWTWEEQGGNPTHIVMRELVSFRKR